MAGDTYPESDLWKFGVVVVVVPLFARELAMERFAATNPGHNDILLVRAQNDSRGFCLLRVAYMHMTCVLFGS